MLDCSGRPHLSFGLHIRQLDGANSRHIVEACFTAFARALRKATELELRWAGEAPSGKRTLERTGD